MVDAEDGIHVHGAYRQSADAKTRAEQLALELAEISWFADQFQCLVKSSDRVEMFNKIEKEISGGSSIRIQDVGLR